MRVTDASFGLRMSGAITMTDMKCSKYGAEMEEVYVPDFAHGVVLVPRWFAGVPEISTWYGVKTRGKSGYPRANP